MNRGGLGARSLNIELQKALNPPGESRVERFGWTFCPGDKVMQVENDYDREVYNGDLGIVRGSIVEEGELVVDFDGRDVSYGFGELDELVLGVCDDDPQKPGLGIPGRGDPADDAALPDAGRATCSIPASPAASGWWCWSGSARRWRSRSRAGRRGGAGRSCAEWLAGGDRISGGLAP